MQYVVDHNHDSQKMQGDSISCDKWRLERSIMNSALQYSVISGHSNSRKPSL